MSLIAAVTSRGHMRFTIKEKGRINAEFVRRHHVRSKNKIFLIVDGGPAHVAKKTTPVSVASCGFLNVRNVPGNHLTLCQVQ